MTIIWHHLITGENHKSGSILWTFKPGGLSDRNTIIYGHNMKDGSMFGTLDQYQHRHFNRNYPCFICMCQDIFMSIRFFPVMQHQRIIQHILMIFLLLRTMKFFFLETLQRSAEYNTGMTVTEEDQVVTLSTCVNTRKDYRYLVHGKLKQKIKMEE